MERRPLKSRNHPLAIFLAKALSDRGVPPDFISFVGMIFAAIAAGLLVLTSITADPHRIWLFVGAAAGIQLRLLCNMLDGMVAMEAERKTAIGVLWNEAPDRFEDAAILVAAGYSYGGLDWLGWLAAVLAVGTAYIRALGAANGVGDVFSGFMSKPRRMAALTAACIIQPFFPTQAVMTFVLGVVALGCIWTIWHRLRVIVHRMKAELGNVE